MPTPQKSSSFFLLCSCIWVGCQKLCNLNFLRHWAVCLTWVGVGFFSWEFKPNEWTIGWKKSSMATAARRQRRILRAALKCSSPILSLKSTAVPVHRDRTVLYPRVKCLKWITKCSFYMKRMSFRLIPIFDDSSVFQSDWLLQTSFPFSGRWLWYCGLNSSDARSALEKLAGL